VEVSVGLSIAKIQAGVGQQFEFPLKVDGFLLGILLTKVWRGFPGF